MKALTLSLLMLASVSSNAMPRQNAHLNFSCSTFPASTSEADLIARFGAENVASAQVIGSDDGPQEGTVVFPATADATLQILWLDRKSKRYPSWIRVQGEHSRWRTPNGLTLGTDLLTVERANRRPFRLAGFQTERQGAVISWAGGRLETSSTDGCSVTTTMQPRYDGTADFGLMHQVRSGREYSSGHPAMQQLNPRVVSLVIEPWRSIGRTR